MDCSASQGQPSDACSRQTGMCAVSAHFPEEDCQVTRAIKISPFSWSIRLAKSGSIPDPTANFRYAWAVWRRCHQATPQGTPLQTELATVMLELSLRCTGCQSNPAGLSYLPKVRR